MLFRQLIDETTHTYTYLIADENRAAVLVDPCLDQVARYLKLLHELNLQLKYTLETHIHADHITGAYALHQATRCQIIVPEKAKVTNADKFIADQETLTLGSVIIEAIATPGHTDTHMAYLINSDRVLTGDALFIRGCGRTDFQNGDPEILYNSVTERLFALPDATLVFPGHDYNGNTCSTIWEEKNYNPRLGNKSRAEFIAIMNGLNLARPQKMDEAIPANEKCGVKLI